VRVEQPDNDETPDAGINAVVVPRLRVDRDKKQFERFRRRDEITFSNPW
jgi:hypothetical protein